MIRKLIWNFKKSISERAAPRRYNLQIPIIISFEAIKNTGKKNAETANLLVRGETKDLSSSGIAFVVPSIRLREYYLVGENRTLDAELGLPGGKLKMKLVGCRYEQLNDEHSSTNSYLIGANIVEMADDERKVYEDFLRSASKTELNAAALKLETDKS
jgi:hypothetical protein